MDNSYKSYENPQSPDYDPIKAEKRADDRMQEQQLKAQANQAQMQNDVHKTAQDAGAQWNDKGYDKATEAKLKSKAKGKEFTNDVKDWGDKAGDNIKEGFEKVKDFFGGNDDRVE